MLMLDELRSALLPVDAERGTSTFETIAATKGETMPDYNDPDFDPDNDDDDEPDDSPVIRKLRKELRAAKGAGKRVTELEAKLFAFESRDALTAAGLSLNERQQRALLRELPDPTDLTPTTLRSIATELGFNVPDDHQQSDADAEAQRVMANAAAGGAAPQGAEGMLRPADFAGWDMARRVDFMERHPEKFAALERGETIRV